jgi:hypothetical protein
MTMAVVLSTEDALATVATDGLLDRALAELIASGLVAAGFDEAGRLQFELTAEGWLWSWSRQAGP